MAEKKISNIAPTLTVSGGRVIAKPRQGYEARFLGADFPQIVDDEMRIHTPLTDSVVTLSFICTDEAGERTEADVPIKIKGEHVSFNGKKPPVIPEPAQWYEEKQGSVFLGDIKAIAFSQEWLRGSVCRFAQELKAVTGTEKKASVREEMQAGDIFFELDESAAYLGKEGYIIVADESGIRVTASDVLGAVWAGKTIAQLFAQGGFPYGEMRDYPRFPVRGFMLDVGRRPMTVEMLKKFTEHMAWYKMNDFQLHLSDNYIFLEDYAEKGDESTFEAYEAFRLESSFKNEKGETAVAKDFSYTKKEMREFILWAAERGVRIVPEIDVPAHALSLTKVFPEHMVKNKTSPLMGKRPLTDHLDVSRPETVEFIKDIFDDYTRGEEPTFGSDVTVHIGADEFLTDYGAYRRFINEIVPHIKKTNTVRMWGGLTWIKDKPETPIIPEAIENVQMNLWASSWADGREMYDMGYELINTIDHHLYMVPNGTKKRGSYTDLLNKKKVFKEFEPGRVRLKNLGKYTLLPAGEKRVLGAAFAMWHDNIDKKASGLTQGDSFDRFMDSAPLMAEKTWGSCTQKTSSAEIDRAAQKIGAPFQKSEAEFWKSFNRNFDFGKFKLCGAQLSAGVLKLAGGESFALGETEHLPTNTEITIDIKFDEVKPGQIIMEADGIFGAAYDLRITDSGKLGFTREGYEYEFDFAPPKNKRILLKINSVPLKTVLKTGLFSRRAAVGKFIHGGTVRRSGIKNSTFLIPCLRIGSRVNSVKAEIYGISVKPKM